jgi:hypothetical protein
MIEEAALWITYKKFGLAFLLTTTLLRQFHISQTSAQTPTRILAFVCLSIPFSQFLKRLLTLVGGGMLKVKCTTRQTRREKEQDIKR